MMKAPQIKTTHVAVPQIYAYTTPEIARHDGWVKIGYTEQADVEKRIKQQCQTADIQYNLEWNGNAVYEGSNESFYDKTFHNYLVRRGYKQQENTEWFRIGSKESEHHFYEFRKNHGIIKEELGKTEFTATQAYKLRDSQEQAVQMTINSFTHSPQTEFLWNAKPRFGKTLAVYDLCLRMKFKNVLIVTNRPAIADSWYTDYLKFIGKEHYLFVSRVHSLADREKQPCLSREQYIEYIKTNPKVKNCIEFVSLQDLKGSIHFGGNHEKLAEVAQLNWDLLVIDEAHEGVDTYKTDVAFDQVKRQHTLHLSGTAFKALANDKFPQSAIFNWTYVDECKAKDEWNEARGNNPYAEMPKLNMYSYRMSDIVLEKVNKGIDIDGNNEAFAFDLNEFFRVKRGRFVHDDAVDKWIDALSRQQRYPFSTPELRNELRHSFWLLNRVDSAKALALKLRDIERHPEFAHIEIVVAAGDGRTDDDEVLEDDDSLQRVRTAITNHPQGTITLSVGQLSTGVTIPEWTAVLILSNLRSPSLYMQAAFRAQSPYLYQDAEGNYRRKENAYIFDFDPARTLSNYEEMANGLYADTASGNGESDKRKQHIRELLNFLPVIGEDEEGEMMPLDAEQVMLIPRKIRSKEVVRCGFMSNFLFANISNIYGCSAAVIDIINKLTPVKAPTENYINAEDIDEIAQEIDENGNAMPQPDNVTKVIDNLFGDKLYGETQQTINDMVAEAREEIAHSRQQNRSVEEQTIDAVYSKLTETLVSIANEQSKADEKDELSNRSKSAVAIQIKKTVQEEIGAECYRTSIEKKKIEKQCETDCQGKTTQEKQQIEKKAEEKKRECDERLTQYISEKTPELLKKGSEIIAETYEIQRIDKKRDSSNEQVRDRLRGFSRTIPSFLMGYGNDETTLNNFENTVPDDVFEEVTGLTKDEFRLLRDGGDFIDEKTKEESHSSGHFFDEVVFNDAVKEFMALRKRLANYFDPNIKEDIFNYIPPQKTNQIFTPKWVVKEMVDLLEKENPGCFDDPKKTFADLYIKSGQYITEIVKCLFKSEGLRTAFPDDESRLRHIFKNQVYGLAPTKCIYQIAMRYILGFDESIHIDESEHHLRQADSLVAAREGNLDKLVDKIFKT